MTPRLAAIILAVGLLGPAALGQDSPTSPGLAMAGLPASRVGHESDEDVAVSADLLDKVVAVAGQSLITLRDIEEDLRLTYLEMGAPQPERFPRAYFERRREDLIERGLLTQYSEEQIRKDIPEGTPTLTPEMQREVQARTGQAIMRMRGHFEDEAAFRAELARWGYNEDTLFQRLMRLEAESLVISVALGREIQLPADEVNAYKAELSEAGKSLYRFRLQHILIALPRGATPSEKNAALTRALDIGLKIRNKRYTFEDAAREFSQAPTAQDGGDLGFVESRDLAEPIREALLYTRPGELTMPVESNDGYHLFRVVEIEDARDFLWQKKFRDLRRAKLEMLQAAKRVERYEF